MKELFPVRARELVITVYNEIFRTQVFTVAGALAFFFLLAFIPLLLVLASLLAYLPVPNLFGELLVLLSTLLPADAMSLVYQVMNTVLAPNKAKIISIGLIGTIWAASGGFSACIDALNIAYDAPTSRPWWKDRLQAILLTLTAGAMAVISLVAVLVGPEFGRVMEHFFGASLGFAHVWPVLRIAVTFVSFVAAIMLLYFLAPNVRQRPITTLPGAFLAVVIFFLGSAGLSFYVTHLTNTSKTYGALGAVVALMLWLYLMALGILVGAELNAELAKQRAAVADGRRQFSSSVRKATVPARPGGALAATLAVAQDFVSTQPNSDFEMSADLAAKDGLAIPDDTSVTDA